MERFVKDQLGGSSGVSSWVIVSPIGLGLRTFFPHSLPPSSPFIPLAAPVAILLAQPPRSLGLLVGLGYLHTFLFSLSRFAMHYPPSMHPSSHSSPCFVMFSRLIFVFFFSRVAFIDLVVAYFVYLTSRAYDVGCVG